MHGETGTTVSGAVDGLSLAITRLAIVAVLAVALAAGCFVIGATPAGASTTAPGDQESTVTGLDPATNAAAVTILGGDTYVELEVQPGHEAEVLGYDSEPYLRVLANGDVEVNRWSPAAALNVDRYGAGTIPEGADAARAPEWQPIGHGGRAIWHDHRIHWMTPQLTAPVSADGTIQTWTIPLLVDGTATKVSGRLTEPPSPSPLPYLLAAAGLIVVVFVLGRSRPTTSATLALIVAAGAATTSATIEWLSLPSDVERLLPVVLLPAAALVLVIGAAAAQAGARRTTGHRTASSRLGITLVIAVGLLAGWLVVRLSALWRAVLVTSLDPRLERTLVTLALSGTVAAALLLVWSGSVRLPAPGRLFDRATPSPTPH